MDLGVAFPDMDGQPGVDVILPRHRLAARAARPGSDGHLQSPTRTRITWARWGHLWGQFAARRSICPPASPRSTPCASWREAGHSVRNKVHVAPVWPEAVKAGPFTVQFAPVSHSIPEASRAGDRHARGARGAFGRLQLIDRNPVVGEPFDPSCGARSAPTGCWPISATRPMSSTATRARSESQLPRTDRRIGSPRRQ